MRGEAKPESGMSGTMVTVAEADALGYLAEKEKPAVSVGGGVRA